MSKESRIFIEISENKIDLNYWYKIVSDDSSGATSSFLGTTRNEFKGKSVERLEYETYEPMAIKEIEKICKTILDGFENDIKKIGVVHRIGNVPVGESSILIVISSGHRKSSLEAVHYAIDTIKSTVPIWKKEFYTDGSENQWKGNCESCHFNNNNHPH
ncbi:hypothetical protein ACTFIZ_001741 [Dictyostelium cf. discoideum]